MIIYENKDVLVVNKPAGLAVHAIKNSKFKTQNSKLEEFTLVDWLIRCYPEIKNVGDPSTNSGQVNLRPGIVHRLDKDTSGVMIIAKNQSAFEYLKKQFAERKIKKTYLALVVGEIKNKRGIIDLPIGRGKTPLRRLASEKARGKLREAVTEYKVLEVFKLTQIDADKYADKRKCISANQRINQRKSAFTLLRVSPKTGRTHQIRVHFKAINHPVVCDKLYSKKPASRRGANARRGGPICPFGLNRQFLHAYSLELTLPASPAGGPDGSRSRFEADLPEDLEKTLKSLRNIQKYDKEKQ